MVTNDRQMLLGQYAGFISRGAALIIDIVIVSVAVIVISWIISLPLTYFFSFDVQSCLDPNVERRALITLFCSLMRIAGLAVILITAPLYFAILISLNGQTIGKYVMGLRVVRVTQGDATLALGYHRAVPLGLGSACACYA